MLPYEPALVDAWHTRRNAARGECVPAIPFPSVPESTFVRGKELDAEWLQHGEPVPRKNEKGTIYGWDCHTGREIVPLNCSYCDYRQTQCWTTAELDMNGTKPIWIVPRHKPESLARRGAADSPASAPTSESAPAQMEAV